MRYIDARLEAFSRDEMYRIFISENVRLAPQNKWVSISWSDFVNNRNEDPVDAEELIMEVMHNAGLSFEE